MFLFVLKSRLQKRQNGGSLTFAFRYRPARYRGVRAARQQSAARARTPGRCGAL